MGADISADIFVTQLAQRHRVLMLGGMATGFADSRLCKTSRRAYSRNP